MVCFGVNLLWLMLLASLHPVDSGWIDEDTPQDKRTTTSLVDGTTYHLVSLIPFR